MKASGKFSAHLNPLESFADGAQGIRLGRMSIEKSFEGDLIATSKGEMLSATTPVQGSAGYVAIEQVTGTLNGREGSFVLQHFGTMKRGDDRLILEVLPESGTDELTGLSGSMAIELKDDMHFYEFDYELGD